MFSEYEEHWGYNELPNNDRPIDTRDYKYERWLESLVRDVLQSYRIMERGDPTPITHIRRDRSIDDVLADAEKIAARIAEIERREEELRIQWMENSKKSKIAEKDRLEKEISEIESQLKKRPTSPPPPKRKS